MRQNPAVFTGRPTTHFLFFCLALSPVLAQQTTPLQPELINTIYLMDSSDHTLKPLLKEPGALDTKVGLTPIKGRRILRIPGSASSFRLKGGNDLEFVIKCKNPDGLGLYMFTKKGNNREATISSATGAGTIDVSYGVRIYLTEFGESLYKIAVRSPEPGEYGFLKGGVVFAFAVDAN